MADEIGQTITVDHTDNDPTDGIDCLTGANSHVVFYSTKNASFDVDLNSTNKKVTIENLTSMKDIDFTDNGTSGFDAGDTTTAFIVAIDGVIETPVATYGADGKWSFTLTSTLKDDQIVRVYYMGTTESAKVSGLADKAQSTLDADATLPETPALASSFGAGVGVDFVTNPSNTTMKVSVDEDTKGIFDTDTTKGTKLKLSSTIGNVKHQDSATAKVTVTYTDKTYATVKRTIVYTVAATAASSTGSDAVDTITFTAKTDSAAAGKIAAFAELVDGLEGTNKIIAKGDSLAVKLSGLANYAGMDVVVANGTTTDSDITIDTDDIKVADSGAIGDKADFIVEINTADKTGTSVKKKITVEIVSAVTASTTDGKCNVTVEDVTD